VIPYSFSVGLLDETKRRASLVSASRLSADGAGPGKVPRFVNLAALFDMPAAT
jgi:hypothetical protein